MPKTAMTITIYGEDDEIKATYSRMFVPWKLLKAAVRLAKQIDAEHMEEDDLDALAGLVVEVFGNRFSIEDLNEGADVSDMMAVLQQIIGKARGLMPQNPTPPG